MPDFAIKVENLSKCYRIGLKEQKSETLAGAMLDWFRTPFSNLKHLRRLTRFDGSEPGAKDLIWALADVSLTIAPGEVVGVIGRNGAGKSTLLKIISRITEPTSGRVLINGRVSSLLEVGTGFHPDLTGRENVYLNGTILGMTKAEINRKFDAIVDFAEVEKFLDTPVKRYSSGMKVRLAFAVAAHLEPEILLVDEVLAVGDASFQKKCLGKMGDVSKEGRTVMFVSHNMAAVQSLCNRSILLDKGSVSVDGMTPDVIDLYFQAEARGAETFFDRALVRRGTGDGRFIKARMYDDNGRVTDCIPMGQGMTIEFHFSVIGNMLKSPVFGIVLRSVSGQPIMRLITHETHGAMPSARSGGIIRLKIDRLYLLPGIYYLALGINDAGKEIDIIEDALRIEIIPYPVYPTGRLPGREKGVFMFAHCSWNHEYV